MIHVKSGTRAVEEAAALRAAAHPGVVELVDATDGVVRTRRVEGRTLGDTRPLTAEEIAGVAGAVATTLADLHDLGIAHGGVDATHVIVADEGRPVLCSLGRGGEPADDVAALGRLVTEMLVRRPPERPAPSGWAQRRKGLGPMLAPPAAPALAALAAEATAADPAHRPSARALAAAIYQHTHSAQLPQAEAIDTARPLPGPKPKGRRWPSHRSLAVPAAVGCAVVVMVSGILVASRGVGPGGASVGKPHGAAGDSAPPMAVPTPASATSRAGCSPSTAPATAWARRATPRPSVTGHAVDVPPSWSCARRAVSCSPSTNGPSRVTTSLPAPSAGWSEPRASAPHRPPAAAAMSSRSCGARLRRPAWT